MRHTALLNEQKARWESDRRTVFVEGQNAFRLRGKSATLAGRPDLVVLDDRDATIIDVKTGREQPWHKVQVMIYKYALPLALPQYRNVRIGGEVVYPTHTVRIPRGALPGQFIEDLGALIRRLAADTPPQQVPSGPECRFCDISAADCPERVDAGHDDDGTDPTTSDQHFHVVGDPQHLIAVTASANRSKGARGPEDWKPDDRSYWCRYAVNWTTIKDTWGLTATQADQVALMEMLDT